MNPKKEYVCRLCLKVAKNGFEEIDDTLRKLFDILLLKLDLHITRDPIICPGCVEMAKKCLYFKSMCLDREEIILSFSACRRKSKQSIKFIYAEKEQILIANDEDLHICRFCMSLLEKNNFIHLDDLLNETMFEMITKYMPEMDFNIVEVPIVCTTCRENLEYYLRFMLNIRDTETKIKAYWKEDRRDNMELMNLNDVRHYSFRNIVEYPVEHHIYESNQESNRLEDTEGIYPEAYIGIRKQEILDIRDEEKWEHSTRGYISYQQKAKVDIMEDSFIHQDNLELKGNESSDIQINHRVVCIDNIKQGKYSKSKFVDTKLCKNTEGLSDLKQKFSVNGNNDSVIHLYKCSLCAYETKRKWDLKAHTLIHQDASAIKMFKCSLCPYVCKRKIHLTTHMLVHKNVSEIKMFKCALCTYEAKRRGQITAHMLIHKDIAEIKTFKCALCAHETKRKSHLTAHMLVHKDVSEIKMYKCALCAYESKRKADLNRHMPLHNVVPEVKLFKCALCAHETKRKSHLKAHMLVHKDVSEIKMYKCALCTYESKRKADLNRHMPLHNVVPEVKLFKCALCTYETKIKSRFDRHVLHKGT